MNVWNLHLLAKATAEKENRMAVLVLEDALHEADWITPDNARRVFDVLVPGGRELAYEGDWPIDRDDACEWFGIGFRAAEVCEVALSLFGREFLKAIVTVLNDQCSDTARTNE